MANFITVLGRGHNVASPSAALLEVLLDELTDEVPTQMSTFSVDPNADVQPDPEPEPQPDPGHEIIGNPTNSLSECGEGCFECREAWMSNSPNVIYPVCVE